MIENYDLQWTFANSCERNIIVMSQTKGLILPNTETGSRGFILSLKLLMPERLWRVMSKPAIEALKLVPDNLLYAAGLKQRSSKFPYKLINDGDIVVQIGAPRDLLSVGRSRSVYFMKCVGSGKVVVFEPDPDSAAALKKFAAKNGLEDQLLLIEKGAWSKDETLVFLSSPHHPASNLIKGAEEITDEEMKRRGYEEIHVPVTTLDKIFQDHGLPGPRLVSITANGSESEILKGMKDSIADGLPYISLAITGEKYPEMMSELGYDLVANDDRGFTFELADKKG